MMAVSRDVLLSEVGAAKDLLSKWEGRIEEGIPGIDLPAAELDADLWLHQFCGELMIVAGKCETLVSVLAGDR